MLYDQRRSVAPLEEFIDAFDLTPAMIEQIHSDIEGRGVTRVRLQQGVMRASKLWSLTSLRTES